MLRSVMLRSIALSAACWAGFTINSTAAEPESPAWKTISAAFTPPAEYANDYGEYRSPLKFADGSEVKTAADWKRRREEILKTWQTLLGPWPEIIEKQTIEYLEKVPDEGFTRHKVRLAIAPEVKSTGYLLVPEGQGPHPAVLVVFYEPETAVGLNMAKQNRDFALQLAKRGFVCLSIGLGNSFYFPSQEKAQLQPLSALAYVAANGYHVLANLPEVDAKRVGVTGHSYGGKWSMFASCLYDKFACSAWSDGGVVFDEKRSNVNYWEPWYLGYEIGNTRKAGIPTADNPRTGAYRQMIADGRDLHELHALMAPRPFLVSGGSEDPPARWKALNHSVEVNKLLGYENRVAMTNRKLHDPNPESNAALVAFFEHFLKPSR